MRGQIALTPARTDRARIALVPEFGSELWRCDKKSPEPQGSGLTKTNRRSDQEKNFMIGLPSGSTLLGSFGSAT
jgi:hypothetical protein